MANHAPAIRIPGALDFMIPGSTGSSPLFYYGDFDGSFTQGLSVPAEFAGATLGDINNDGVPDLVTVESQLKQYTAILALDRRPQLAAALAAAKTAKCCVLVSKLDRPDGAAGADHRRRTGAGMPTPSCCISTPR
jgi:hypothetical protein